jgi:formylglycine-generating enzyme required for sulfatase activity
MVAIDGGKIVLGLLQKEVEPFAQQFFAEYQVAGNQLDDTTQQELSDYFQGWVNDQPQRVASFELARYVLTNAQFARFIAANGYDASQPWWDAAARAWLARNDAATSDLETYQKRQHKDRPEWWEDPHYGSARPNHPVVGISWYEATAFAKWLTLYLHDGYSYYLPSELEWEYAARGTKRNMYAWGNSKPDAERVNFDQIYNGTTTVGCFSSGATQHGLLDLAGNVWEWTRSAYCSYPYNPTDGREDPIEPAKKRFTLRGGGWDNLSINLRASDRDDGAPDNRAYNVGVRLARRKNNC